MKDDLLKVRECLDGMNKPLIERKPKPIAPDDFQNIHQASINNSHTKIKQDGNVISKLIKEINDAVKIDRKSKAWKDYQEFINDIVIEGISLAICTSLQTLNEFIDMNKCKKDPTLVPLFDIKIELNKKISFYPEIEDNPNGFTVRSIINSIIGDFQALGILIQRIDTGNVGDYLTELKDNFEIRDSLADINNNLDLLEEECNRYRESFNHLEIFWTKDPEKTFQKFLEDEKEAIEVVINDDGQEVEAENDDENPLMNGVITRLPKFELFDQKILELKEIKAKMSHIKSVHDIGWLRVNAHPLKTSLESNINNWINIYTNFLLNQVKNIISNCDNFEKYLVDGITKDPSEYPEDKKLLMKVMEVLAKHRIVNNRMEKNFSFLKETILLLKKNNVDTKGEDYLAVMETKQANFKEIFQNVIKIKTNILGLLSQETQELKKRIKDFFNKVRLFREEFLADAPFNYDLKANISEINASYDSIDEWFDKLECIKKEAREFNDLENLFELELTKYKALSDCRTDLEKLKFMWDLISLINHSYASWMVTNWKAIDVEACQVENDQFCTLLNKAKEIKSYKGYAFIQEKAQNMKKILN